MHDDLKDPRELLRSYALGKCSDEELSACEAYLEEHPEALAALKVADDPLVQFLRAGAKDTVCDQNTQTFGPTNGSQIGARPAPAATAAQPTPGDDANFPAVLRDHPRYRVLSRLGAGGMGEVFLAEHRIMRRRVALKLIHPQYTADQQMADRFRREIDAAARLHHPNIVAAFDADEISGVYFLAMEYVEGESLKDYLDRHPQMPVAEACDYIRQAALGLEHARLQGMVHRDIKPHNMMRTPDGAIKILDFGLAALHAQDRLEGLTATGVVMGTPDYMAPEQTEDTGAVDIRADIYSLGCTFFQLLTGRVPFPKRTALDKLIAHRQEKVPPIAGLRPEAPRAIVRLVERMTAKAPEDRIATPGQVADLLQTLARVEAKVATPPPLPGDKSPKPQPPKARPRSLVWSLLALAALGVIALAVIVVRNSMGDEFTIRTDDPNIELIVRNGGRELILLDPMTKQQWQLDTEKYQISDAKQPNGLTIDLHGREPFVLKLRGERAATVTFTKRGPTTVNGPADELKLKWKRHWPGRHGYRTLISPDGKYVAMGGSVGEIPNGPGAGIRVWEVATGNEVLTAPGHNTLTFSPDSRTLYVSTYNDNVIRAWSLVTWKQVQQYEGHTAHVTDVMAAADGKLISASTDKTIRFWDVGKKNAQRVINFPGGYPSLRMTRDGKSVLAYDYQAKSRELLLYDVATQEVSRRWTNPYEGFVGNLELSADGRSFLMFHKSTSVSFWRLDEEKPLREMPLRYEAVATSPDLKWLLIAPPGAPHVQLIDLDTGKIRAQHPLDRSDATGNHSFSRDGRLASFCDANSSTTYLFEMPKETWVP